MNAGAGRNPIVENWQNGHADHDFRDLFSVGVRKRVVERVVTSCVTKTEFCCVQFRMPGRGPVREAWSGPAGIPAIIEHRVPEPGSISLFSSELIEQAKG